MTGVATLVRHHLRRDRWMIFWWCVGGTVLYWSQAVSVAGLYATQAEFDKAAKAMDDNAAFIAMAGPARALDTVGGQVAWQATAFGAVVAGLMSMFLIAGTPVLRRRRVVTTWSGAPRSGAVLRSRRRSSSPSWPTCSSD